MPKIQDKTRSWLISVLKFALVSSGCVYIIFAFKNQSFSFSQESFDSMSLLSIALTLSILSFLNWFGEIKKWQILIQKSQFKNASKETLIAHGLSIFTPQKLGEFGGKCMFYSKKESLKIISLTGLGQMAQLFTTIAFGVLGLILLSTKLDLESILNLQWLWIFVFFLSFFFISPIRKVGRKIFADIPAIEDHIKFKVLAWSVFRYLIFSHQFVFLIWNLGIEINYFDAFWGMSLVYLVSSIIPIFAITDTLVKGSVCLTIFTILGYNSPEILFVIFLMWIFNTVIPASIGYIWMFKWHPKLFTQNI